MLKCLAGLDKFVIDAEIELDINFMFNFFKSPTIKYLNCKNKIVFLPNPDWIIDFY